jgi:putative redox protein
VSEPMSLKALFESTQANLRDGRARNPIHVKVRSENQGGFRSCVKIRDFTLTIDQPKGFGGTNTGPKPSEVLLASLAACQDVTWRLYADALGIPLRSTQVELDGLQDLRGFLDVDATTRAGFQKIVGTVTVDSPAADVDIDRLKRTVDLHCPVLDDLRAIPVELAWRRADAPSG